MTIIASVKARDGIVLATDSMSTIIQRNATGQATLVKTYGNARKLFRVRDLPIGIMSYGLGNIGVRSMENLVLEFSRNLDTSQPSTVESISKGLYQFIKGLYDAAFQGVPIEEKRKNLRLGFYVSGYSSNKFLADEWEFLLPDIVSVKEVRNEDRFGISWRGVDVPFGRLFNGFDPRIIEALKEAGVQENVLQDIFKVGRWRMPVEYSNMPVQDAIDFAVYILETTIGAVNIEISPAPSCGGSLQVAVILPESGWQWVREPTLVIR